MRKTVHLCLSSHDEIMYRSEEDLNMGFNCLALAILSTESRLLAEGFLTTHNHCLIQTENHKEVFSRSRYAYTRYFNAKYGRKGRLGEKTCFSLEIEGLHHMTAALNYIIRQGLHHGLATTPFAYPHCSANAFFRKELGKSYTPTLLPDANRYLYLPRDNRIPSDKYRMSSSGLLLREDIIDTAYVEEVYISPRNYLFQMNKASNNDQECTEQRQENDAPPITVEIIEAGVPDFDSKAVTRFEQGRVDRNRMTDLELCEIIDRRIIPLFSKESQPTSIYGLPESTRSDICALLWKECRENRFHSGTRGILDHRSSSASRGFLDGRYVTESQLRRCLCIR